MAEVVRHERIKWVSGSRELRLSNIAIQCQLWLQICGSDYNFECLVFVNKGRS
jgi:hypothetical protein